MWHYAIGEQTHGPFTADELFKLISRRQIQTDTPVWREGMTDWAALDQTELMDQFDALASPPAPAPVEAAPAPVPTFQFDLSKELPVAAKAGVVEQDPSQTAEWAAEVMKGANWFYWIAGLSILNLILIAAHSPVSMALGLGSTDLVFAFLADGGSETEMGTVNAAVVMVDLVLCGLLCLFGWLASQGNRMMFILGTLLVALDSMLFLFPLFSIVALVVHGIAVSAMFKGILALGRLNTVLELEPSPESQPA